MLINCLAPCVECPAPIPGTEGLGIDPNPNDIRNPFVNLSSEAPDEDIFIGRDPGPGPGPGGPGGPNGPDGPGPGGIWFAPGCIGICLSKKSQEDADICAFNQKVICDNFGNPMPLSATDFCKLVPNDPKCNVAPSFCQLNPFHPWCKGQPPPLYVNDAQSAGVMCPDGSEFVITVPSSTFYQSSVAKANALAKAYALMLANKKKICMSALTNTVCCTNAFFSSFLSVYGGIPEATPPVLSVSAGELPEGLALQQAGGRSNSGIVGMATVPGTYTFSLTATNATASITREFTILVIGISDASLPDATKDTAYSTTVLPVGPVGTTEWLVTSGALPAGLAMSPFTGHIVGVPTTAQIASFTISMFTLGVVCRRSFTIDVQDAATCPDWSTQHVWDVESVTELGIGSAAGFYAAQFFAAGVSSPGGFPDQATLANNTLNPPGLVHNGPACNYNLHIEISVHNGGASELPSSGVTIYQEAPFMILAFFDLSTNPVGVYDIPFTIPDSGGVPVKIIWAVQMVSGGDAFIFTPSGITLTGLITLLP